MMLFTLSIFLLSLTKLGFCLPNAFNVPFGGYNISAGQTVDLTWSNRTDGFIGIYLMPKVGGFASAWSSRIDIKANNLSNVGAATVFIPDDVTTGDQQFYFFEIENPDLLDANNADDTPDGKNGTNYSDPFLINAATSSSKTTKSSSLPITAIVGIAVGGVVALLLAGFVIYLRLTRTTRRDKEETADLNYRPKPHQDMAERGRTYPQVYNTPPRQDSPPASIHNSIEHGRPVNAEDMTQSRSYYQPSITAPSQVHYASTNTSPGGPTYWQPAPQTATQISPMSAQTQNPHLQQHHYHQHQVPQLQIPQAQQQQQPIPSAPSPPVQQPQRPIRGQTRPFIVLEAPNHNVIHEAPEQRYQ